MLPELVLANVDEATESMVKSTTNTTVRMVGVLVLRLFLAGIVIVVLVASLVTRTVAVVCRRFVAF